MSEFEDSNGQYCMNKNFSPQILEIINHIKNNTLEENSDLILSAAKEDPRNLNNLFEIGVDCAESGKVNDASIIFECLKSCNFNDARIPYNLGFLYTLKQDYQSACSNFHEAYKISPNDLDILINYASSLHELKQYNDAISIFNQALELNPDCAHALTNKGVTLFKLKRFDEALVHHDKALSVEPNNYVAWSNKGNALNGLNRFDEAIAHFDTALSLKPNYYQAHTHKGFSLFKLKRYEEALVNYDEAISIKPSYADAWSDKGNVLFQLSLFEDAIIYYDKALSLQSDHDEAAWSKSLLLLLLGDYQRGLPLYESRWRSKGVSEIVEKRFFDKPTWLGIEPLNGKTILLYGEQGLGDFIQFCRYAKLVFALGAKVILEAPQALAKLLVNLPGVSTLVVRGQEIPPFDFCCPLLSLPLAFITNVSSIPAENAYIASDLNKMSEWSSKLGPKTKKRIGLVWSSMSSFQHDSKRSLLLSDFVKALPTDGYEYICLQKEIKDCDKEFFKAYKNIQFYGDQLNDFSDTAALIECVDLVISTCTSVPHLSAAMGKETWVIVPHVPDWRWLLDREDSPWYPSVKLYRQSAINDWSSVLERVKLDLASTSI